MALPTNALLQTLERLERERLVFRSALWPTSQFQQAIEEINRSQQDLRDMLERSNPLAEFLEKVNRSQRMLDSALGSSSQLARMATQANATQLAVERLVGGSTAFAEFANRVSRQQQVLDQAFGSALHERLLDLAAVSRSLTLSPIVSESLANLADTLETAPSDAVALRTSEQRAVLDRALDVLLDALDRAIDAADEKIDQRALLRFINWLLPMLIAVYSIWYAHVSSDQTQGRLDQVETAIEGHRSENSLEHGQLESALKKSIDRLDILSDRLEERIREDAAGAIYVVVRPVPMTEDRRYNGIRTTWLLPGQEVEVLERSKKWLRVTAYDLESGETHVGWVLKKYLKRVTEAPLPPPN